MTCSTAGGNPSLRSGFERTYVRVSLSEGIARLVLDRPPLNVLNLEVLDELDGVLEELEHHPEVKLLVLSGAGPAFCAGADVADHLPERVGRMLRVFRSVVRRLLGSEFPTLAVVHGATLGAGCELMMACDLAIAADGAQIGQPEVRLGVFPPVAAALLPRLVGRQRALDLILTGRTVDAAEAHRMELVSEVIPAAALHAATEASIERLAGLSGPVLRLAKRAVLEAGSLPPLEGLQHAEEIYLNELMRLHDPLEGLNAFLEKRRPAWKEG